MSTINDFKQASESIYNRRTEIKQQLDELSNNLYSSLVQLNFSMKLIADSRNFINQYINSEESILSKLTTALTTQNLETNINMYNNIAFNNLFCSNMLYFENFSRLLLESVSNYLVRALPADKRSLRDMHKQYCKSVLIKNDWDSFKEDFTQLHDNYKAIFNIPNIVPMEQRTSSQGTLLRQYNQYKTIFDNLETIFIKGNDKEFTYAEIEDELVPAILSIINFKTGSTLYSRYLDKISEVLLTTNKYFIRLNNYTAIALDQISEYQPTYKQEEQYLSAITQVIEISIDLIASLTLQYPNKQTKEKLITSETFTKLLTTINNLYQRELQTATNLINTIRTDYKFIKSLETFITTDTSLSNKELFKLMTNFDNQNNYEHYLDTKETKLTPLSTLIKPFFNKDTTTNKFNKNSFITNLNNLNILTEPLYDILNYHQIYLFKLTNNTNLIFNFLETLYLYNKTITKQTFNNQMKAQFQIKLTNTDYTMINESKLNETLTAKYPTLNNSNYFDITPLTKQIKQLNNTNITPEELQTILSETSPKLFHLITFQLTKEILYTQINIKQTLQILSTKTNIRTTLFKLLFTLTLHNLLTSLESYSTTNSTPLHPLYNTIQSSLPHITEFQSDLSYLQQLLSTNDYHNGNSPLFNPSLILNFTDNNIWDPAKTSLIQPLFEILKEV